jgi:glyoxylase-like metal-dependent hydrolase (beta-lactamase superfamily II)
MRELIPGLWHWTAHHPRIGMEVSSYHLERARVTLNPLLPPEGLEWFAEHGPPTDVLLTNRHHLRDAPRLVDAFRATVRCHRAGMHEFGPDAGVVPFDFGDELPGGIVAEEVDAISPEETALHLREHRALAFADGLINDGGLSFVPDGLMGDDPEGVKRGLLTAFRRLLELDVEHLLPAHGAPVVGDGGARLREFVERASA